MMYNFIKMVANRNVRKLRRYRQIYLTQTYIILTDTKVIALATGITIIGFPIMIRSSFDSLLPILETLDDIQANQEKILQNQEAIEQNQEAIERKLDLISEKLDKSEKTNQAIKKSIDDYQNRAWYQKLLDNISIEVSLSDDHSTKEDDSVKELEKRLKALETPPSSPPKTKPISK